MSTDSKVLATAVAAMAAFGGGMVLPPKRDTPMASRGGTRDSNENRLRRLERRRQREAAKAAKEADNG